MGEHLTYDEMRRTATEWFEGTLADAEGEATALLEALGVHEVLEALSVAESVIRAADSFHPVARFFVEGSAEQRLILEILASGEHWGPKGES